MIKKKKTYPLPNSFVSSEEKKSFACTTLIIYSSICNSLCSLMQLIPPWPQATAIHSLIQFNFNHNPTSFFFFFLSFFYLCFFLLFMPFYSILLSYVCPVVAWSIPLFCFKVIIHTEPYYFISLEIQFCIFVS